MSQARFHGNGHQSWYITCMYKYITKVETLHFCQAIESIVKGLFFIYYKINIKNVNKTQILVVLSIFIKS